jgi:hypothetical protein
MFGTQKFYILKDIVKLSIHPSIQVPHPGKRRRWKRRRRMNGNNNNNNNSRASNPIMELEI